MCLFKKTTIFRISLNHSKSTLLKHPLIRLTSSTPTLLHWLITIISQALFSSVSRSSNIQNRLQPHYSTSTIYSTNWLSPSQNRNFSLWSTIFTSIRIKRILTSPKKSHTLITSNFSPFYNSNSPCRPS